MIERGGGKKGRGSEERMIRNGEEKRKQREG
jgi:hypothetical protein